MNNNNLTIDSIINMLKTYINLTDYTLITKSFNYVKNYMDTTNIITGSAQTYSSDVTIKIRQALDFYSLKIFKNGILIGDF